MTSVRDLVARPTHNHEPNDAPDPTATLVDGPTFDRVTGWGAVVEHDVFMGRAYAYVGGRWYATELDVA